MLKCEETSKNLQATINNLDKAYQKTLANNQYSGVTDEMDSTA